MNLAETIRESIRGDGRSLAELARVSGVDKGQLSRFVRAERSLDLETASRLCEVLGLILAKG